MLGSLWILLRLFYNVVLWLGLALSAVIGLARNMAPRLQRERARVRWPEVTLLIFSVVATAMLNYEWLLCIREQSAKVGADWWPWVQEHGLFASVAEYLETSYTVPGRSVWVASVVSAFLTCGVFATIEGRRCGLPGYIVITGTTFIGGSAAMPGLWVARRLTSVEAYFARIAVPWTPFPLIGIAMCVVMIVPDIADIMTVFMLGLFGPVVATWGGFLRDSQRDRDTDQVCASLVHAAASRVSVPRADVERAKKAVARAGRQNQGFFWAVSCIGTGVYLAEMRRAALKLPLDLHFIPTVLASVLTDRAAYVMGIDIIIALGVIVAMLFADPFVSRRQFVLFALGCLILSPMGAIALLVVVRERNIARTFAAWLDAGERHGDDVFVPPLPVGLLG